MASPACWPPSGPRSTVTEQTPRRIVLATRNPGKLAELAQMLEPLALHVAPVSQFDAGDVEETATTFVENALIKARAAALVSKLPAVADDPGLEVDALGGAPGVRSARYAGSGASDEDNVRKLLHALADAEDAGRTARFHCVAVYLAHSEDPSPIICEGVWEGRITREPRGRGGFGYDPVFEDLDSCSTAAELSQDRKNALSHRGQAMAALVEQLRRRAR